MDLNNRQLMLEVLNEMAPETNVTSKWIRQIITEALMRFEEKQQNLKVGQ